MPSQDHPSSDLLAYTRQPRPDASTSDPVPLADPSSPPRDQPPPRAPRWLIVTAIVVVVLVITALIAGRLWLRHAMQASLPQLDGTLNVPGLSAPVTVQRDPHGTPTIRAASIDDLIVAQGYITAQDRLFQMDTLRRHAAGELAEILGSALIEHDRLQRILELRSTAERAVAALPPDQLHYLDLYAEGVNAAIVGMGNHLPFEFRVLRYTPSPWTPRDSLLVALVMFQDLTNRFPEKLNREALSASLAPDASPELRAQLLADLYPVGSWRDHPPTEQPPDLTAPVDQIPEIPLDDSQVKLHRPLTHATPQDLVALGQALTPSACSGCRPGSNNWVVSGAHTASGHPLLSNDMHLTLSIPGIWYAANLEAPASGTGEPFHVAGVTLPGAPFVIVGHNAHVAWGFTNLGADVQDLYIEHLRGSGPDQEFQATDGSWHPVLHQHETIHVRGGASQSLDLIATLHGQTPTPIISPMLASEHRPVALRWVVYDPGALSSPFFEINSAPDSAALVQAFASFAGPSQNLVYADDHGHIGYHATGRIPLRGSATTPSPLSEVPTDSTAPDALTHEWSAYIPYSQLPQTLDPPAGIIATANARITPDAYPFPITQNSGDPYRNQRIWKLLTSRLQLTPPDMLAIQGDIDSDPDRVIAQRLAYALDHASLHDDAKRLHQAADLLRSWKGQVTSDSPAAAIVDAARTALWPMLLSPKLHTAPAQRPQQTGAKTIPEPWQLYLWGERAFAEEQLIVHTPARWLPSTYENWDNFLAAAVRQALITSHAPSNLAGWRFGKVHPLEIQHPLFAQSVPLQRLLGLATGVRSESQGGDGTTVKQVGRSFGPSERFTADLGNLDASTLNLVLGESGNPASPYFLDQFPAWLHIQTFPLPFNGRSATTHTLVLRPR